MGIDESAGLTIVETNNFAFSSNGASLGEFVCTDCSFFLRASLDFEFDAGIDWEKIDVPGSLSWFIPDFIKKPVPVIRKFRFSIRGATEFNLNLTLGIKYEKDLVDYNKTILEYKLFSVN